jgi:GDP-mannose 6-dehydrogenase
MGYVGCVTAACLASMGNRVYCVDVVEQKVKSIRSGRWPVFEEGLDELCARDEKGGFVNVEIAFDADSAVIQSEASIICVGTPGLPDGRVDLSYLKRTITEIASAIAKSEIEHTVIVRSTIPPGTTEKVVLPILEENGVKELCHTAFFPEFLREGSALNDFFTPNLTVVGCENGFPVEKIGEIFLRGDNDLIVTRFKTAEALKYANNAFHAFKIAFTNEFARTCKAYGVDSGEVMSIFCRDTVLNISHRYLKPGFAFGGSCLPKDLRALEAMARKKTVEAPLFSAVTESNKAVLSDLLSLIFDLGRQHIGFFGVTFKLDTDDIRESPVLHCIEKLLSKIRTYQKELIIQIFDMPTACSKIASLYDSRINIAQKELDLVETAELIVLGPYRVGEDIQEAIIRSGKPVIDLKWYQVLDILREYEQYHCIT